MRPDMHQLEEDGAPKPGPPCATIAAVVIGAALIIALAVWAADQWGGAAVERMEMTR